MATTPLQALPVPSLTDPPNGPSQFLTFGTAVEQKLNMVFADAAARDAAITGPVAGMVVFLSTPKRWYYYDGSAWILSGGSLPRCFLTGGAATGLATATVGTVLFATETYDTDNLHSTVTNTGRVTIPTGLAGVWRIGYSVDFVAFGAGDRQAWIWVNGTGPRYAFNVEGNTTATVSAILTGSADVVVAAGDYVQVHCYQTSGGAMNVGSIGFTVMQATYVGPS
jgi:hypothetical protein